MTLTLALATGWTVALIAVALFYALVFYVGRIRAMSRESASQRFELEASSKDFNYRRELRVKDRSRRGPEVEAHWGKTKVGRDRGRAA